MKLWGLLVVSVLLLAGCSSSGGTHASTSAPTSSPPAAPVSVAAPSIAPTTSAPPSEVGTIDLGPNWTEMKKTLVKDWTGTCLLAFSCTGSDALDGSFIGASFIDVTGEESITVTYVANDPSDNSGAQLDLGHFAEFFSTDTGSQLDFSGAVNDALDALPVGHTATKVYAPLKITIQHPTDAKWLFKVDQS